MTSCKVCFVGEYSSEDGQDVCTNCGMVREDFACEGNETNYEGGRSEVEETFLEGHQTEPRNVKNARKILMSMVQQLDVNQQCLNLALRYYVVLRSKEKSGSRGRRMNVLLAACLYLACPFFNCPRNYNDFAQRLGIPSSSLYRTVNVIKKQVNVDRLPIEDVRSKICTYFVKLNLERETDFVTDTYTLLEKTKESNIDLKYGHPQGILGAILLISLRSLGKFRTAREVAKVVGVSRQTIQQRLLEFFEDPNCKNLIGEELTEEPELSNWLRNVCEAPWMGLHSRKFLNLEKATKSSANLNNSSIENSATLRKSDEKLEYSEDLDNDDLSGVNVDEYILGKAEVSDKRKQMKKSFADYDRMMKRRQSETKGRKRKGDKGVLSKEKANSKKSKLVNYDVLDSLIL